MKKLLVILVSVVALNVNAQLVIKEATKDTVIWQATKLSPVPKIIKYGADSAASYTTDVDYIRTGDLETTIQFYELCQSVINDDKEYNLELDGKTIVLRKSMGAAFIWINDSYFYLNSKYLISILNSLR